jgi:hypothetical protein
MLTNSENGLLAASAGGVTALDLGLEAKGGVRGHLEILDDDFQRGSVASRARMPGLTRPGWQLWGGAGR